MSVTLFAALGAIMVATSFLSGLFGMAGGLVLIGALFFLMPIPLAMALHSVAQIACNVWRAALWRRHIRFRTALPYGAGCLLALAAWSVWRYVPSLPIALVFLGLVPFAARLVPEEVRPRPENACHGFGFGVLCMTLMMLTGVAGPVLDQFFLNGRLDRREIVATKGVCQMFGHGVKLLYFGEIVSGAQGLDIRLALLGVAAALTGTSLSKRFLEAMGDDVYRRWAGRLVTAISGWYVGYGTWLVAAN